jgi:YVTN family beta-propeller protein
MGRFLRRRRSWLPVFIATLLAAVGASACRDAAAPPAASVTPAPRERVYVSNETAGTVAVIDPATGAVEAAIPVGKRPRGLKVSRDGKTLYVALSGSPIAPPGVDESTLPPADRSADGIGVVDLATRKVIRTIHSGQDPEAFDLSPDGKWLYVSNEETAEMSVVDLQAAAVVKRVPVGEEPEGVTVSPDGKVVYVTCEGDHTVRAIDTSTFATLGSIVVGQRPRSIAVTPDGRTLFVTDENSASISVVDTATRAVSGKVTLLKADSAPMPPRPMGAVLSPDAKTLFVSNGRAKSVSVIDVATRAVTRTLADVGQRPWGIGIDAAGARIFTANGPAGDVSIVNVATGAIERRISLGGSPWGVVVASAP